MFINRRHIQIFFRFFFRNRSRLRYRARTRTRPWCRHWSWFWFRNWLRSTRRYRSCMIRTIRNTSAFINSVIIFVIKIVFEFFRHFGRFRNGLIIEIIVFICFETFCLECFLFFVQLKLLFFSHRTSLFFSFIKV